MDAIRWEMAVFDLAGLIAAFAGNFLAQTTALIVAGWLAAWCLRRFGSSAQSAIHRATLIAVLTCPALSLVFSALGIAGWTLPIPMARVPSAEVGDRSFSPPAATIADDHSVASRQERPEGQPRGRQPSSDTLPVAFQAQPLDFRSEEIIEPKPPHEKTDHALPRSSISVFGWVALGGCLIWIACTAILLVRLTWAWRRLRSIRHAAIPLDHETKRLCEELSVTLGVTPPLVLKTPFLPGPCLAGIFRPVILIPDWNPQTCMREILIHELAHLRRHDGFWNLLRQLATAVYFFQPLLWQLSRKLEISAEEVCDDWVVELGADRQAYAHTLADVAQWSSVPMAWPSVAMAARPSLLGQRVRRILDQSRPLSTNLGQPLAVGITLAASLGVLLVGMAGAGPSRTILKAADENIHEPSPKSEIALKIEDDGNSLPSIEQTADSVLVRGRVLRPDGKPASGALVTLRLREKSAAGTKPVVVNTETQNDGKFTISYPRVSPRGSRNAQADRFDITAQAKGLGMQWVSHLEIEPRQPLVLSLKPEFPIHGRIVDTQGKPIAGVQVNVAQIGSRKNGEDLKGWVEVLLAGGDSRATDWKLERVLADVRQFQHEPQLTDRDGRFTITGMGSETVVDLALQGEAIANQRVTVATRKMEPLGRIFLHDLDSPLLPDRVFGAYFTYTAVPNRVLEGTIRDALTKQPLPNVVIKTQRFAGMQFGKSPGDITNGLAPDEYAIATTSDAQGRYRLTGLPKGDGPEFYDFNEIWVIPSGEIPYFKRAIRVPAAEGDGPQTLDIDLHRGNWIHGRVTEKGTLKPIQASVAYRPFLDNPHIGPLPEFQEETNVGGPAAHRVLSDREGRFRLPGLPGPAIVTATAMEGRYLYGTGSEQIPGKDQWGYYPTIGRPYGADPRAVHALKEIDPKIEVRETQCDFALDAGETMHLTAVDQAGRPVPGCTLVREIGVYSAPFPSADLEVPGLTPGKPTDIIVIHKERKLGKITTLTWKSDGPRTTPVTLEPCATVKGRVVDEQGKPFKIPELVLMPRGVLVRIGYPMAFTNADGTFEYANTLIGCKEYVVGVNSAEIEGRVGFLAKNLEVKPGEIVDLGTIKVKRKK